MGMRSATFVAVDSGQRAVAVDSAVHHIVIFIFLAIAFILAGRGFAYARKKRPRFLVLWCCSGIIVMIFSSYFNSQIFFLTGAVEEGIFFAAWTASLLFFK